MYQNLIKCLLDTILMLIENKTFNQRITYVKNDIFPNGVYRIHTSFFVPVFLASDDLFHDKLKSVIMTFYSDKIKYDRQSGWLTIFTDYKK